MRGEWRKEGKAITAEKNRCGVIFRDRRWRT